MGGSPVRGIAAGLGTCVLCFTLVACSGGGGNLDGVYHGAGGGPITLTIKGGKATVTIANESKTMDYKVDGNKLTLLDPKEGNVVFTINDDGTLNGELGVMSKK